MPHIDDLIRALDELLDPAAFDDYGPNGLQVPGRPEVRRVVTGVSAQRELVERAVELEADLVLVHHGLFWRFLPVGLTRVLAERLRPLFKHDIGLAAYHLPLDAHPEVGNNALICEALGLDRAERFGEHRGQAIGFVGRSGEGIAFDELRSRCARAFGQEPFTWDAGPETVHSVGIVSGAAASSFVEAIAQGLDAFLTGEPAEHVMADARESGTHFIAAGHYATETFGIRRIGELLDERFGVEHHFVEVPNPI